jgi:TonB family protein
MTAIAFSMPNEGHLGGFEIRRFIQRFMTMGLMISLGVHGLAIGSYKLVEYLESRRVPPPIHIIPYDRIRMSQPPSIRDEEAAHAIKVALPKLAVVVASIPKPVTVEVPLDQPAIPTQDDLSKHYTNQTDSTLFAPGNEKFEVSGPIPDEEPIPGSSVFVIYEQEPQWVKKVEPIYPDMAAQAGVGGTVVVRFYVDKKGEVRKVEVAEANPKGLGFEEAAIAAVMQCKLTPALQRNSPVGVWMSTRFNFKIK